MKRMAASHVLIIGLSGLGVEIAKNVSLAGVKSVTLSDPTLVTTPDLGTQFFLRESDIGQRRDVATRPRLAELNAYTPVSVLETLSEDALKKYTVVVLVNGSTEEQLRLNNLTHGAGIKFIAANTAGLFGSAFCDFGVGFPVVDTSGETPLAGMVVEIEEAEEAMVTCLDETRHGLEDGDYVRFSEVEGMEINAVGVEGARKVTVKGAFTFPDGGKWELTSVLGPYTFTIGDTRGLGSYRRGGWFHQVKMPKLVDFVSSLLALSPQISANRRSQKPLRESILDPEFLISDFAKWERPSTLHIGFQALSSFLTTHSRLPAPRSATDAAAFVALAKSLSPDTELDAAVLTELAYQATGDLSPINAVIGAFVAQEVLKACTGKFSPLHQHLYFDALEALPDTKPTEADCAPSSPPLRLDGQIAVFGREFQEKIAAQRVFLVGAGAIGCEMLKNWAMMGLAEEGQIYVTDLDTIEKSNLNRQFLFRARDVGSFKSEAGRRALLEMNPRLEGKVEVFKLAVGAETEGESFVRAAFDALELMRGRQAFSGMRSSTASTSSLTHSTTSLRVRYSSLSFVTNRITRRAGQYIDRKSVV